MKVVLLTIFLELLLWIYFIMIFHDDYSDKLEDLNSFLYVQSGMYIKFVWAQEVKLLCLLFIVDTD